MDFDIETNEFRGDRRTTRPGLDRLAAAGFLGRGNLDDQLWVDEITFFARACHGVGKRFRLDLLHLPAIAADDDLVVGSFGLRARRETLSELAPRRLEVLTTASAFRLTTATTVRVIDRVHGDTADPRATALPAVTTSLTEAGVVVIDVTDDTNGGAAFSVDVTLFTGRKAKDGAAIFDA